MLLILNEHNRVIAKGQGRDYNVSGKVRVGDKLKLEQGRWVKISGPEPISPAELLAYLRTDESDALLDSSDAQVTKYVNKLANMQTLGLNLSPIVANFILNGLVTKNIITQARKDEIVAEATS